MPRRLSRARKERREGDSGRLPSVPFPWSLAADHQTLASTLRKTKRLRRRLVIDSFSRRHEELSGMW